MEPEGELGLICGPMEADEGPAGQRQELNEAHESDLDPGGVDP